MSESRPPQRSGNEEFATTRWSLVLAAGRGDAQEAGEALESLCASYWYPLYAYIRRRVPDPNEAQDLTQAFFAALLEKDYVGSATPERGRFRAFLLTAFKHFVAKQWAKQTAQKRGGGRPPLSLDFESAEERIRIEPCVGLTAEQLYDRQWTVALLEQIMGQLEREMKLEGKGEQFAELRRFLVGDHSQTSYAEVAGSLRMTEAAAKMAAHRMRRRYRQLLRAEISQTVSGPDEIQDEIRKLFTTLEL